MSVATFTDTMAEIVVELNDREIYNDIRSQIDITEQTEVQGDGTSAEYKTETVYYPALSIVVDGESSTDRTLYTKKGHTDVTWTKAWCSSSSPYSIYGISEAECTALGGNYYSPSSRCSFTTNTNKILVTILSRTSTSITIRIINKDSLRSSIMVAASYRYKTQEAIQGPIWVETETRTLMVRAIDAVSIAKYGRRVMNLTWPLGQSQEQMQSLVNNYLAKYKEAVPQISMTIKGINDTLIEQILVRKISDMITVQNTELGMSADFFINSVKGIQDVEGILKATYELEQVRAMEAVSIFTLDASQLDGPDILGW